MTGMAVMASLSTPIEAPTSSRTWSYFRDRIRWNQRIISR